jgi:aminomethyltransferase
MVDFAGWSMPVQYSSIVEEHNATRNAVGVFDISHMGRLQFGGDARTLLDRVLTRSFADMKAKQIRYSLVCNERGGILDDVLIYRGTPDGAVQDSLVVNASNREKIVAWLDAQIAAIDWKEKNIINASVDDITTHTTMIAVQGPLAISAMEEFVDPRWPLSDLRYYNYMVRPFAGASALISRSGYTGEDGIEIVVFDSGRVAEKVWKAIIAKAESVGGRACGLGARDTLRLEAAMPLYGHELNETTDPIRAGLNFAVNLEGREFIGSEALQRSAADKSQSVRVGLMLDGKRVAREGCAVLQGDEVIGEVTSGTFSPTLQKSIAMAYVKPAAQTVGTQLTVDIRGTQYPAKVVQMPFYKRTK